MADLTRGAELTGSRQVSPLSHDIEHITSISAVHRNLFCFIGNMPLFI